MKPSQTAYLDRWWTTQQGVKLHARDYPGAGGAARLPVFCLHGLTRNARDFEAVAPAIAEQGRRVLAFDIRGRGLSDRTPDPQDYVPPVYASDVVGWAAALGVSRAVFVGTSLGGLVTMALAAAAPSLVAAAVLNDIGPEIAPEGLGRIAQYTGAIPAVATWAQAQAYTAEINAAAFPRFGPKDWEVFARRLFRDVDGRPELDYDPLIAQTLRASRAAPPPDLWPLFEALAGGREVLLIRGALSDLLSPGTRDAMMARAPHLQTVEVADVGHAPTLSEPEAQKALAAFLARTP